MSNPLSGSCKWAGFLPVFLMLLASAFLTGCQSSREALQQLADANGRHLAILPGQTFPLVMLSPQNTTKAVRLRVYLEGDGFAWATATQPSLDPSPRNLLVARLAIGDPTPNAYLARPCQFIKAPACKPALWTHRRFSQEVVSSISQAMDQLKQRYGNREFELVGYSGGAALALLLAAQRDDVTLVQTIAGNVSPRLWAQIKNFTPLSGSLDPLDYRDRLATLPQRHLIGAQDCIVPGSLADVYLRTLAWPSTSLLIRVPGASHDKGWEKAWQQLRNPEEAF